MTPTLPAATHVLLLRRFLLMVLLLLLPARGSVHATATVRLQLWLRLALGLQSTMHPLLLVCLILPEMEHCYRE